jgi:hypothetical protein
VQEGASRLRQDLGLVDELCVDVYPPSSRARHPGRKRELAVDRNGLSIAYEDARRHRGEAVPRGEQAARFVERSPDQPAVDDSRPRLVDGRERNRRFVALEPLFTGQREMNAIRVVAAPPAGWIVMWRDARARVYLSPPRSKWAR